MLVRGEAGWEDGDHHGSQHWHWEGDGHRLGQEGGQGDSGLPQCGEGGESRRGGEGEERERECGVSSAGPLVTGLSAAVLSQDPGGRAQN